MLWLALFLNVAQAEDLVVKAQADVTHVVLDCGLERHERTAAEGKRNADGTLSFTFPVHPGKSCTVMMAHPVTQIEQLGTWQCDPNDCVRLDGGAEHVAVGPGELKVLWKEKTSHNLMELTCDSGFRSRAELASFEATFTGVPDGTECTLNWKGGAPLKFRPVTTGAWQCRLVQSTPVCTKL